MQTDAGLDRTWCARACEGLQGPYGAALNDGARVSADVGMCLIMPLGLKLGALDRTSRELLRHFTYFSPVNRILMAVTCSTLKHQKLTKTLEKDTTKGLTNIS